MPTKKKHLAVVPDRPPADGVWFYATAPVLIPPAVYADIGPQLEAEMAIIRLEHELAMAEHDLAGYDLVVARAKEDLTWEFRPTL